MPSFSQISSDRLQTCHPHLRLVAIEAIKVMDFSVIYGHRDKHDQDVAYTTGKSQKPWPTSKHNTMPSMAMDLAPYPIDWSNERKAIARFYLLGGVIMATAAHLGVRLRAGWDWDMDFDPRNNSFDDLGHYEVIL